MSGLASCRALRWETAATLAWSLLIAASGALGLHLALGLPEPARWAAAIASAAVAASGVAFRVRAYAARRARILELCGACGDPVAWPRRTSYTCRLGDTILCYNYALDRFYAYRLRGEERRLSPLEGLDYYCVKMLGGRAWRRGGLVLYKGAMEALSHRRGRVLRGEGRLAYGPASLGLEAVVGGVSES